MKKRSIIYTTIAIFALSSIIPASAATVIRENAVIIPEDQKTKPVNPASYETQENKDNSNNQSSDSVNDSQSNTNQNNSTNQSSISEEGQKTNEGKSKNNDWLGSDGVAKTPSYNSVPVKYERPLGDVFEPRLYATEYRNGDAPLPKINPATGQPLWATQPFWRADGSFDMYGYLKQFQPYYDNQNTEITAGYEVIRLMITDKAAHWDVEHIHPYVFINIPLSTNYNRFNMNKERAVVRMIEFTECRPSSEKGNHVRRISWILRSELKDQVRLTGSNGHFVYASMIPQLEELMRDWLEDPSGNRFKNKPKYDTESTHIFYEILGDSNGRT